MGKVKEGAKVYIPRTGTNPTKTLATVQLVVDHNPDSRVLVTWNEGGIQKHKWVKFKDCS